MQIEMLRERLRYFSEQHAEWISEGWRVSEVEKVINKGQVVLNTPSGLISIYGRIDRIDTHRLTGQLAILDYKTGDNPKGPVESHRKKSGEWVDLQLPLYRFILSRLGANDVQLGLVSISSRTDQKVYQLANWGEEDYESANRCIQDVANSVLEGVFWPPSANIKGQDDFASICGVGQRISDGAIYESE